MRRLSQIETVADTRKTNAEERASAAESPAYDIPRWDHAASFCEAQNAQRSLYYHSEQQLPDMSHAACATYPQRPTS